MDKMQSVRTLNVCPSRAGFLRTEHGYKLLKGGNLPLQFFFLFKAAFESVTCSAGGLAEHREPPASCDKCPKAFTQFPRTTPPIQHI